MTPICTCWDAVRDTHCPVHGGAAPFSDPAAQAQNLRRRAAELRAEASRLDRRAAFLTLDAHKRRTQKRECQLCGAPIPNDGGVAACGRCIAERP